MRERTPLLAWLLVGPLLAVCVGAQTVAEAPYLFTLGKILVEQGEYREAGEYLARAVAEVPDDAYLRLEYADYLLDAGDVSEASRQLEAALELAPEDPQVLKSLGQMQLQASRQREEAFDAAKLAFEKLRDKTPGDLESMSTLGRIYLSEQRFGEAADVFRQALSYWPRNRALHGSLIDALLRAGDTTEAEAAIEGFLRVDPASIRARLTLADLLQRRGEHAAAVEVLRATPHDSGGDGELFRQLALALYELEQFPEALFWLDRGLEVDGVDLESDPQGLFVRALLLTAVERTVEARDELERLLTAHPERVDALQFLTRLLLSAGDWQAVVDLLAPRLRGELDEERAELALLHAEALRELGRDSEALDWLARAAGASDLRQRALAAQVETLFSLGRDAEADEVLEALTAGGEPEALLLAAEACQRQERFARSVPLLERLLAAGHEQTQVRFWLGAAYERTGRPVEAESQLRSFLEERPDSAPALNYLGYMWADSGVNLEEALELVERAVALDPDNGAYIDSLGWAHFQLGNYEEARTHLERAAGLVGDDAVVLEHLGDLYSVLGRHREAVELYRRALELEGENADAVLAKLQELEAN